MSDRSDRTRSDRLRTDGGEEPGDAGFDEWLAAIGDGEGYYLESPSGDGSLPPRRICPHSGSSDLEEKPLPETGEIEAVTVVHVASPQFAEDTPYATAVVDFGPVRLTGVVRGIDLEEVETGTTVEPTVEERETTGDPLLVFRPV
ncbi:OB-fold domain and Zn-ribbon containing protein,possible acyl-CoA-binding protein [Halalkaliarchaeum sp. AArc-CO]|uniref:Zn-ribbon domain-containing OB-fold protein n=1 Tax=unclassified Halalkaliarchaeum TaxID=2678344 RepID=UPI00217D8498|nr:MULTISPECIES: OB-fold domain-containing protein [unclassified Halalkaliarchaeum]MDR5671928.1 OB-fold domain-containing protein [Halalkaliarchaeum sp. AArc-GB]UWG51432.1 OB-fold domain and Zn-ribbon containing protein,possible acyl-CoA-binding protein [Halalkaliarchaeum sp. AArc-CO]